MTLTLTYLCYDISFVVSAVAAVFIIFMFCNVISISQSFSSCSNRVKTVEILFKFYFFRRCLFVSIENRMESVFIFIFLTHRILSPIHLVAGANQSATESRQVEVSVV